MSNAETRDSPSRGGAIPTLDDRNKEASSVPQTIATSPTGMENINDKELYTGANEMQME